MVLNELSFAIDKELYCRVYNDFSDEAYDKFGEFIKCLGNSTVEKIYGIQNNGLAIRISGELTNYFRMKKLIPYNVYDDNTHTSIPCGTKYNITKVYKYPESQDFAFDISTSYGTKRISGFYNQEEAEKEGWVFSSHKQSLKSSTVYSDSFDDIIQKDFTYKGNKYTWNDSDCVYYNDNGDEDDFFMEIPEGAITSAKKLIESDYMDCIDYPSRMFKGARFENPNGVICEIVKVEPENNYVLYKFNDEFPEDTTIDGIIALLKHNSYYPIASNTPGKVIREEEDDAGYIVQLVELDDGRYKVCDNNGTEDICNTYDEARKMFYMYLG